MKFLENRKEKKRMKSPPSRGAWIEIAIFVTVFSPPLVAPLAGGVD